jgi:lipoprotein-releasing system permease protein
MKSWLPFEWIAAVRFLLEGRLQTLFIVGGVAIGVGVIVFMSAMLSSLEANFIKRVLTSQPHIQLLASDQIARPLHNGPAAIPGEIEDATVQRPSQRVISIDQWPKIRDQMLAMPEITAVSPTMLGSALAVRGDASRAITMSGVDPATYFHIVPLPDYIVKGEARLTSEDIVIGIELAKNLGARVGDKLNIQVAAGANRVLTITGLVDLGNKAVNQRNTYVALRTAQSLLGMIGGVTTIDMTVRDVWGAEAVARQIQASSDVEADSWIATNAQFYSGIKAQTTGNTLIRFFVGLSVAFGIAAVLVVSVIQRSREIGILRAMGTSRGQILRVFLLQGGLLGFLGSIFGAAMGAVGIVEYHAYTMQPDGTELFPLIMDRWLFIDTAILATLTGLLAALAPALRAARLDPVVAIRG